MNITELDNFNLADTVKFHNRLNPRLWGRDEHLLPEVQRQLLAIADDFREFLGVTDLDVEDITVSGSNAAYSYTPASDIDLHLVVRLPEANADVLRELFAAKKYQYNDEHDIRIGGADVELYVQPSDQPHISQGIYSLKNQDWIQVPRRRAPDIDDTCVQHKAEDLQQRIDSAVSQGREDAMQRLWDKIKTMRQTGLEQQGEFGCDNLAFKALRRSQHLEKLKQALTRAHDQRLSLDERRRKKSRGRVRYAYGSYWAPGFAFGGDASGEGGGDGGGESTMPRRPVAEQSDHRPVLQQFVRYVIERLEIDPVPRIVLHKNSHWSEQNHSFGRYDPDTATLHVSLPDRHILDVMRTTAHELVHCHQHQTAPMPADAGETGSAWENDANAQAGVIMRDFTSAHPELFDDAALKENASGYIPTKKQARDPRYVMALTVDVKPGEVGRQANKMALKTDAQGRPALLMKTANLRESRITKIKTDPTYKVDEIESLRQEFALLEDEFLGEINMSPSSLRQEAARTGAIAGMEFEMIVPNTENDDGDLEPDYDQDERCRSIDDAVQFFHDGDYNGRREVERLRERMRNDFQEWLDDKLYQDWERSGEEYLEEWVPNNVDESEWNPEGLEGEERQEALEVYIANLHSDPGSSDAFEEFREENFESYDESDWLDAEDLDRMSGVENAYEISWPYWTSRGEASIEDVADDFESAIGRTTRASSSYHSGRVQRPGPGALHYVVEPDGSLDGDNPGDTGLEFVSPPLPIDEILSDLNQVKTWAKEYGCYTNDSTGLHINISVPNYSRENLDFVKLALLLGDKYVLDLFGRASNTYAKSALDMVRDRVRSNPEDAAQLLNKMKGNLDSLASKSIHSGITQKYTSINTKDGHIEFRSPGGDWLDENFDKIENTLLRFTVAMSAALNPEAYREEYLKKLYKLLTENNKDDADTIRYFSEYVAGKIPKAALRSFVKQAQLQRRVKRGKTDNQKMWWNVSNPGNSYASVEVVATSKEEAIEKALGADGYPSWANTRQSVVAKPIRPYEEKPAQPVQQGSATSGNWGIWVSILDRFATMNVDGESVTRRFGDQAAARAWIQDYNIRNPGNELELTVQEIEPAAPEPQGADTSETGQWKVIDGSGREIYRFRPAHNTRAKANELAAMWAREYNWDSNYQVEPAEDTTSAVVEIPYEIYNRQTGEVVDTTQLRNDDEAMIRLDDYRSHGPHRLNRQQAEQTFGIRRGPGVTNTQTDTNPLRPTGPGPWEVANRANNQVYFNPPSTYRRNAESEARTWLSNNGHNPNEFEVRTRQTAGNAGAASQSQYTSTPIPGVQDVELDIPLAPRTLTRPGQGQQQWTGEWLILDPTGQELHRFSGIGNNQSDANRVAMNWLRQVPGRLRAGVTVVPEMQ